MNPKYKKDAIINDKKLYSDIYSMKILKDIKNKEIEKFNELIKDKFILNKKMIGFNKKTYQYSIYSNAMKKILPKIDINNNVINNKSKCIKKIKLGK